ncbi:MAG TPA: ribosome maturation factor RimM [Polyangia bacterium]
MAAASADNPRETLALGVLGRPHGVRGELVFHPHNPGGVRLEELDFPIAALLGGHVRGAASQTAVAPAPITLVGARPFGDKSLVRIEGLASPEAAAPFTNRELFVPRSSLPPLAAGEYYVADLVGCRVTDAAGMPRGKVTAVFWNGRHDVLTVTGDDGAEILVPAVPDFLVEVDLAAGHLVIDDHE